MAVGERHQLVDLLDAYVDIGKFWFQCCAGVAWGNKDMLCQCGFGCFPSQCVFTATTANDQNVHVVLCPAFGSRLRRRARQRSAIGGDAPSAALKKSDYLGYFPRLRLALQPGYRLPDILTRLVNTFVGQFDRTAHFWREASAAQPDTIDAGDSGWVAVSDRIRRDVFDYLGAAGNHHVVSDVGELVNGYQAGDEAVVTDSDMTRQHRAVPQHVIVAYDTVVAGVEIPHEIVAVADDGPLVSFYAAADIDTLFELVVVADHQRFAVCLGEGEILGLATERGTVTDPVVAAQQGTGVDAYIAGNAATLTDAGASLHYTEWADFN